MKLQLKRIRESKGISQKEMAELLTSAMGRIIKVRTYGSWERQEVGIDVEQAYYCAIVLGCTIDEIAGMPPRDGLDADEREIVEAYRSVTFPGKRAMMVNARAVREEYVEKSDTGDVREATA